MKQLMERYNEAQEKADPYARAPRAGWMEAGRIVAEKIKGGVCGAGC